MTNEEIQAKLALAPKDARVVLDTADEFSGISAGSDVLCVTTTYFPSGPQYVTLYDYVPDPIPLFEEVL